jgi:small subunit ribosomal protein S20
MANTSSAKKEIRAQAKKRAKNLVRIEAYKSARREVTKAIAAGDTQAATAGLVKFQKAVDKAAKSNGPLHKNTAARYKSRLSAAIAKLTAK